ncbi:MAG: glycosyltransferase family 2 protein [Trueperaceae bacterium]
MTEPPTIDILLATYQGEPWLEQQLQSIQAQTHQNWRLLARDDGSADGTREILERFVQCEPERAVLFGSPTTTQGAKRNFGDLLEASTAPYTAFCDQDDFWLPNKLELTLSKIRAAERTRTAATPILAHTDLTVVDGLGRELAGSFWSYQAIDPNATSLRRLLVQNVVTGCTTMINEPLRNLSRPVPDAAIMHDWWCAIVAAATGDLVHVEAATVQYRQHGANALGAQAWGRRRVVEQAVRGIRTSALRERIISSQEQANALLHRLGANMRSEDKQYTQRYAGLPTQRWHNRKWTALREGYRKRSWIETAALLLWI